MLEAELTKYVVVEDNQGRTVLNGVAEYFGDKCNFQTVYDWDTLDYDGFIEDLRESIAKSLELPVYRVDVQPTRLLQYMKQQSEWFKRPVH